MGNKEKVALTDYGKVEEAIDPVAWPSGRFLLDRIREHQTSPLSPEQEHPDYWQVSARWALLSKYGMIDENLGPSVEIAQDGNHPDRLVFSREVASQIQSKWQQLVASPPGTIANDLSEFMASKQSNNRTLQWTVMKCQPGCQFHLHAHPNLELVYCLSGALFEIRMAGEPFRQGDYPIKADGWQGPSSWRSRPWSFGSLSAGRWLVNEEGSIHKSFTAANKGCVLLVLWGGAHADIVESEHIQNAVDTMDERVSKCTNCTEWQSISETFLPESEKSTSLGS